MSTENKEWKSLDGLKSIKFTEDSEIDEETIDPTKHVITYINPTLIFSNPDQPRKFFDKEQLENLKNSIVANGTLQPLLVVQQESGGYELIAGERRLRAARLAELSSVPTMIFKNPDTLVLALLENIQRQDLTPLEEAVSYRLLIKKMHLTHEDVARKVGCSRSSITNSLRLLDIGEYAKEYLEAGYLEMGHARALLALTGEAQIEAVNKIIDGKLNVRQTEQLVQRIKNPIVKTVTALPAQERILLESWRERLSAYTSQVKIKMDAKNKIKLTIECNSPEEAEQYIEDIERLKKPE